MGPAAARAVQLGGNSFMPELCTPLPHGVFASGAPAAGMGLVPASTAAVSSVSGPGPAAGASPFSLGIQGPVLLQTQKTQLSQVPQDTAELENLALTLSALGLHQTTDGQLNMSVLEAALRQQC
jgi:hypothetical protein